MQTTMKIKYVSEEIRSAWQSIEQIKQQFTEQEIVEMVNRYQDTQKHAITYRVRAAEKAKLMKSRLAELEAMVSAGTRVDVSTSKVEEDLEVGS